MDTLRIMINKEKVFFLMLSRTEQELLVDKILQKMVSGAALGCHGDWLLGRKGGKKGLNKCTGAHRCLCHRCLCAASFLQEMYTGVFTEEEFRSLGIMAPFVVDEVFIQLDRSFFTQNLDYLRGLCYKGTKMDMVARILQEATAFG